MKSKNIGFTGLCVALFMSYIEVHLFDVFKEKLMLMLVYIPETLTGLIANTVDFTIVVAANISLLSLLRKAFEYLKNKYSNFMKIVYFLDQKKRLCVVIITLVLVIALSFSMVYVDTLYKTQDNTPPAITVTHSENTVIKAKQYETPVVYHVYFSDETKVQKTYFDETSVYIDNCTANIVVDQEEDGHYIIAISNIEGETGLRYVIIKKGAVIDSRGNRSKEVKLSTFYLYNNDDEVDLIPPRVTLTQIEKDNKSALIFDMDFADDKELLSIYILPEHIIPIGFSADIRIVSVDFDTKRIILDNIVCYNKNKPCELVVVSGVATDAWNNKSEPYIIQDLIFT